MSISPILTFKAGECEFDPTSSPPKVKPVPTLGYVYLYIEDELVHFCWRPRSAPLSNPSIDLIMFPGDCSFLPYEPTSAENISNPKKPTNGRIFVLKFSSSSQRQFFWMQSRSQHPQGNPDWFSARDLKLGQIVHALLQGEEVNVQEEISNIPSDQNGPRDNDDEPMEDVEGTNHGEEHHRGGSGGAGPDATGGDVREEGQESREGGADGGRAAATSSSDASTVIQNLLNSLGGTQQVQRQSQEKLFTTLADLLTPTSTIPLVDSADAATVDHLLSFLPPVLLLLAQEVDDASAAEPNPETTQAALQALSLDQKKAILQKVMRSPQFSQSLSSLTVALRDGGLPSISEALKIPVRNGGYMRRGGVPLGGGDAVEAFLEGVKDLVEEEERKKAAGDRMETDQ